MSDSSKVYGNLQREAFRKAVYRIWNMIQAGLLDEMDESESGIAKILLDHPEYEEIFEDTEILDGREFDAGTSGNPFLHISFHKMVDDQLASGRPEEVRFFLESMEDKGYDRHEIVHALMKILVCLISDAMKNQKSLDVNHYRRLLVRYGNIGPDEVTEALEREFLGH